MDFVVSVCCAVSVRVLGRYVAKAKYARERLERGLFAVYVSLRFTVHVGVVLLRRAIRGVSVIRSNTSSYFHRVEFIKGRFIRVCSFIFNVERVHLCPVVRLSYTIVPSGQRLVSVVVRFARVGFERLCVNGNERDVAHERSVFSLLGRCVNYGTRSQVGRLGVGAVVLLYRNFPNRVQVTRHVLLYVQRRDHATFLSRLPTSLVLFSNVMAVPQA